MTERRMFAPSRLAGVVWALTVGAAAAAAGLAAVNGFPVGFDPWGIMASGAVIIGSLGALVASRRPGNAVGWLMVWMGLLDGVAAFGMQYGYLGMVGRARALWGAEVMATVPYGVAIGMVFSLTITFLLLLFPDGKLPSPRWLPVAMVAGVGVVAMTIGLSWFVISLGADEVLAQVESGTLNAEQAEGPARIFNEVGHMLVFVAFPFSVASLFVRRRRAGAVERQQLRWFAYGAVVFFSSIFIPLPEPYWFWYEVLATTFLFVAIGIAILRYRLYDIDRVISRTVAYAVLTGILVGLYFGVVFTLQLFLPTESDLAIVASTLAAAAAFNPLRRRVQDVVDRRFNRSRYDAERTVEHFSRRLRGATDASTLADELQGATASVMEPVHLSLWLRESGS